MSQKKLVKTIKLLQKSQQKKPKKKKKMNPKKRLIDKRIIIWLPYKIIVLKNFVSNK